MLITVNILPLVLMFVLLARLAERFGTTDWGRIFVVAAATLGTLLNTFAVVLNNHTVAAVSAAVAIVCVRSHRWPMANGGGDISSLAGLAAAFTAADDLPRADAPGVHWAAIAVACAAANVDCICAGGRGRCRGVLRHELDRPRELAPPYMHRSETDPNDNWYKYTYTVNGREVKSYWYDRQGIDKGEPSKLTYAFHVLVGHHGIFSLTPIWFLRSRACGCGCGRPIRCGVNLAIGFAAMTLICLVFYIGFRPQEDRNYGGMTSGFRWMFWFTPLWIVMMIPAADRLARSTGGQVFAAVLLSFSVLSASYPTWNPWVQPGCIIGWCGAAGRPF